MSLIASLRRYRHLVYELTKREFMDRYAQQAVGAAWAWLHPLLLMLLYVTVFNFIFAVRFGKDGGAGVVDLPRDYTTYVLSGLVPWLFLQDVLGRGSDAIVAHRSFVKQMAFPVDVLPVKRALSSLPILFTGTLFLVLYQLVAFGSLPWTLLLWPLYAGLLVVLATGIVFLLGSVGVYWRDLREVISVFTTANLFLMPVLYLPGQAPKGLQVFFWLNPFSYPVWLHQDLMFYGRIEHPLAWVVLPAMAAGMLLFGLRIYKRLQPQFGDVI
jgi:lipopolysaccharide transport system permease protein